ncbi:MAG: hypothetical protein ACUVYA_17100 [Planctomycetota bacterium]
MRSRARRGLGRTGGRTRRDDPREMLDCALPAAFRAHVETGRDDAALRIAEEMSRRRLLAGEEGLVRSWFVEKARRLAEDGSFAECEAVARKAFALGVGSVELADLAFHSALARGDLDAARSWASDRDLLGAGFDEAARGAFEADLAVLEAAGADGLDPSGAAEARRAVTAFVFHQLGKEEEARAELAPIGRRSPFARWRLVILGLAALQAGDRERARACWERVSGPGVAASFARALLGSLASGVSSGGGDRTHAAMPFPWCGLEDTRLALLEGVRRELERGAAKDSLLAAVRRAVLLWPGGASEEILERLHRAILGWGKLPEETIRELFLALGPLPEDPRGLKELALALERRDPPRAQTFWRAYAERFDETKGVEGEERRLALALVWEHMGDLARAQMLDPRGTRCGCVACRSRSRRRRRLADACSPGAAECYAESARLDPGSLHVRKKWVEALSASGKKSRAEQVRREILKRWPADVETLVDLGERAHERGAFSKAARLFDRARALEPLNRSIAAKLADAVAAGAWKSARSGRIAAARRDAGRAADLLGEREFGSRWTISAAIEFLAGDAVAGERAIERAVASGTWEPAALLDVAARLEEAGIDAGIARRVEGALEALPAGVADLERAFDLFCRTCLRDEAGPEIVVRAQLRLALYLKRAARLREISEEARLRMCRDLREAGHVVLLRAFAAAGRKQFPSNYRFAILEADARLGQGRYDFPADLWRALDRAKDSAAAKGDHEALQDLARLDDILALLARGPTRSPLRAFLELAALGLSEEDGDLSDLEDEIEAMLYGDGDEDDEPPRRRRL